MRKVIAGLLLGLGASAIALLLGATGALDTAELKAYDWRVRQTAEPPVCVLIAVSGYGDSVDRERARQAGFDHHLTKPADPVQLADLIVKACEER